MTGRHHPFLLLTMFFAIGMRAVFGAPCCMDMPGVESGHHAAHAHHGVVESGDEAGTDAPSQEGGEETDADPSANPCCSACSPPLPSQPLELTARTAPKSLPEPTPVRSLATRPPYPAYEATGPPALI